MIFFWDIMWQYLDNDSFDDPTELFWLWLVDFVGNPLGLSLWFEHCQKFLSIYALFLVFYRHLGCLLLQLVKCKLRGSLCFILLSQVYFKSY